MESCRACNHVTTSRYNSHFRILCDSGLKFEINFNHYSQTTYRHTAPRSKLVLFNYADLKRQGFHELSPSECAIGRVGERARARGVDWFESLCVS
jgi:hypothetical protein